MSRRGGGKPLPAVAVPSNPEPTLLREEDKKVPAALRRGADERTSELFLANERLKEEIAFRKKIEEDLRETQDKVRFLYESSRRREHLYHSFLTASPDAIVIYDEEGKTRYVSPSFTRLFGWAPEEVHDKRIPYVPDSERQYTMTLIDRVWKDGCPLSGIEVYPVYQGRTIAHGEHERIPVS